MAGTTTSPASWCRRGRSCQWSVVSGRWKLTHHSEAVPVHRSPRRTMNGRRFCSCLSFCHSLRESAFAVVLAFALAFLSVIPSGNLLLLLFLPLPLLFFLSFPPGICFCCCACLCPCFSFCHSLRESAFAVVLAFALAFLSVIPSGNLLCGRPTSHDTPHPAPRVPETTPRPKPTHLLHHY